MRNEFVYHLLKLIHRRIIQGFLTPFEDDEDRLDDIKSYAVIVGVSVEFHIIASGILVIQKEWSQSHQKQIKLLDVNKPSNFLLGRVLGYPIRALSHGGENHREVSINYIDNSRNVETIHVVNSSHREIFRVEKEIMTIIQFLKEISTSSDCQYIMYVSPNTLQLS